MPVVEARMRPLAGLVEDVADVLRQVRLGFGRARARRIVVRRRERVADVVRVVVAQALLGLERHAVIDRLAVEADRSDRRRAAESDGAPGSIPAPAPARCAPSRCRRRASTIPCTTTSTIVDGSSSVLQAAAPRLRVLDRVGVVHDARRRRRRSDRSSRMSRVWNAGTRCVGRHVHLLGEEERQVARERRLHAVGPLIEEDAVAAADDRAIVVERQRESRARRQAHFARAQQAALPPGLLRTSRTESGSAAAAPAPPG